jgi:transmembrane serine protease 3
MCWRLNQQGRGCKSANFIESQKKCETFQDDAFEPLAGSDYKQDPLSINFVKIFDCQQTTPAPTEPTPPPEPTAAPLPKPENKIPAGSCGQTSWPIRAARTNRIVGGYEAVKHSIPWIVSLRGDWGHHCGGTLIRVRPDRDESDIVITAAHCMERIRRPFNVTAGAHYKSLKEQEEVSVLVVKDIDHPSYNQPRSYANDITVLKLAKPIKFSSTIQPACLPAKNEGPAHGTEGIVAGWGYTGSGNNGEWPDKLMQVTVPVIGTEQCQQWYSIHPESMLCAGYELGGKDSCQGDSGGPYFTKGRQGYTLQGVVSWGSGCALAKSPGVYARVTTYIDWIQEQIRMYSDVYRS